MENFMNVEDYDWVSKDLIKNEHYYIKHDICYNSVNNTQLFQTHKHSDIYNKNEGIKFSSVLSGKNIIIHGGGTIATLGKANNEDYAIITGIIPKNVVIIELICPISCQNLLFGMCNPDKQDEILTNEKKNFKSFRTTTRRRVVMEINYSKRIVKFFLDGVCKDFKSVEFDSSLTAPCIIFANRNTSVILNSFSTNLLPFPIYLSSFTNKCDSLKNIVFISEVEDINDEIFKSSFKGDYFDVTYSDKSIGITAVTFNDELSAKKFIEDNKNVKISNKDINLYSISNETLEKFIFKEYDLGKLAGKCYNISGMILRKLNHPTFIKNTHGNTELSIVKWFLQEYVNIKFIGEKELLSIKDILEKIESIKTDLTRKRYEASKINNLDSQNLKIEYISDCDKMLIIDESYLKIISRDQNGLFPLDLFIEKYNSNTIDNISLVIKTSELINLLSTLPWSNILTSISDKNEINSIALFLLNIEKAEMISDYTLILTANQNSTRHFIQSILFYLNKVLLIQKEKLTIQKNIVEKKENGFDIDLDQALPFAPDPIEIDEGTIDTINEVSVYNTIALFSVYNTLLHLFEQISVRTVPSDEIDFMIQPIRWSSAFSRLGSFVNFPIKDYKLVMEMANKGLYVDNTLNNELKLYGNNYIKVYDADKIDSYDTLDNVINRQFPFNYINRTNFYPNINLEYTINVLPCMKHHDPIGKNKFPISNICKSERIKIIASYSENGLVNLWNYSISLNLLGFINVKKGIKKVKQFRDIKEINWLKKDSIHKTLIEIMNEENFDIKTKIPPVPIINNKPKEKDVSLNQDFINNLYIMGFPLDACKHALKENKNNLDKALEYLLEKSNDNEFMKSFTEKEVETNIKVQPWHCTECTYLNENGALICDMCGTAIPDNILKEHLYNKNQKKEEIIREGKKMIENVEEELIIEFKDCLIKGVHLLFDNKDPIAPILIVAVLFDVVKNKMIVSIHKFMINPVILRDYISYERDSFVCKIDNRKFHKIEEAISYINENYTFNIFSLYPLYVGKSNIIPFDESEIFKTLIPIEHSFIELPVVSIFDSFAYEKDGNSQLCVLCEKDDDISLYSVNITNSSKFVNIGNESIQYDTHNNSVKNYLSNEYPTELKIIRDESNYYIVASNEIIMLNQQYLVENKFSYANPCGLLKRVDYVKNNNKIDSINVYDDINKLTNINIRTVKKNLNESNKTNTSIYDSINAIKIKDVTYTELNILSQLLDFERVTLVLNNQSEGIIKTNLPNQYKKIYFDLRYNNKNEIQHSVNLLNESLITQINMEFIIKPKNNNLKIENDFTHKNNEIHQNYNTELTDITNLKNLIPLTVLEYRGSQSHYNINVSLILFGEGRFTTNYPNADFLFSNLHDNIMLIDNIIVGSDTSSKSGDVPFGEGLIFLLNNLESINLAKTYSNYTSEEFKKYIMSKNNNCEEIYEWEPVAYIIMGEKEFIKTRVSKQRACKYIYFLPTNSRRLPKDYTPNFHNRVMSINFFAVEGNIYSTKQDNTEYLHKATKKLLSKYNMNDKTVFNLSILGNTEIESKEVIKNNQIEINGILPNTYTSLENTDLFLSRVILNSANLNEHYFKNFNINLSGLLNDDEYSVIGYSIELQTYKTLNINLKDSNNFNNIEISSLRNLITEVDKYQLFNKKLSDCLFDKNIDEYKRLFIIKYLKHLLNRIPFLIEVLAKDINIVEFIILNILRSNTHELINSSIEFIRLLNLQNTELELSFITILDTLHEIKFSNSGLKHFMNLILTINSNNKFIIEKIFKQLENSIMTIKEMDFQNELNIYLRTNLKFEETPFDENIFLYSKNDSNYLNEGRTPLSVNIFSEVLNIDTMHFTIDLQKIHKVETLRLLFPVIDNFDTNFKIIIWGSNSSDFHMINERSFYDYTWRQLTKYDNILKMKEGMFSGDVRSLEFDFDFTGRYLIVEILFNQGERTQKEIPLFYIVPEVIGEICLDKQNYEFSKINDLFLSFISVKSDKLTLSNGKIFNIKTGNDNKYLIEPSEKKVTEKESVDIDKLKCNLHAYQTNLKRILSESIKRRDNTDIASKIKTLIEDIKNIQSKIHTSEPIMNLRDSYSINNNIQHTFLKHIKSMTNKDNDIFIQTFLNYYNNDIDRMKFIENLIEVSIINNIGDLRKEALSFLKNLIWPNLDNSMTDKLFDIIVDKYLTNDVFYRNALEIIEILSFIDFNVESILQKLKEAFKKQWNEEQIPDAFFNISSLIIILIMKLKSHSKQISNKCVDIINFNIEFIKYLTTESKFSKDINNIILSHSLNLLQESFQATNIDNLNEIITPELIEYMVNNIFQLWDNIDIKKKISIIIDYLIDPYMLSDNSNKKSNLSPDKLIKYKLLSDKITLNAQKLTLKYLTDFILLSGEKTDKIDYILNLLIKTYTINNQLLNECKKIEEYKKIDDCEIRMNNSLLIEKFIVLLSDINQGNKIGYSYANNIWKYLTDILERGNLEMMFYNNTLYTLIIDSFLKFDVNLQEILYTKLIKVFTNLYTNEVNKSQDIFDQVIKIIIYMIKNTINTNLEEVTVNFMIQICDIIACDESPYVEGKETCFNISYDLKHDFFREVSCYLLQHLNISSFTGSVSSNKIVYNRLCLARILLVLISTFVSDYLTELKDIPENFNDSVRNYLTYIIFDYYEDSSNQPPVLTKVAKTWIYVNNIIELCSKRKKLIEVVLKEFMKIVRKVDDHIIEGVRTSKISLRKGIVVSDKLFNTLELVLNKCLYDDEISKFFAFELQGFKFFIDRVNVHKQMLYLSAGTSTKNYKLNTDLLKSLTIDSSNTENIENKEEENYLFTGNLKEYVYEEFASINKLSLLEGDPNEPNIINNVAWSNKKKVANGHIYTRDMKNKTFYEESFLFKLNHLIEVKDIIIGFNCNMSNLFAEKLAGVVPTVILEAGQSLDKMDVCVKMDRMDDIGYLDKGVIAYGFNFYAFNPNQIKLDDNYLDNILNQLINCRAKIFRFIVRRPYLLSNDNSHNVKINFNNIILGINHVSIIGTKIADTQKVLEFIQEKEKNVSIKIISKIFTAEFIDTLKYIAQDSSIIDNIKQIYDAFEPYIKKHANILSNILINVSKYNYELGEWLLNRLLNSENSEIHAKLSIEIAQNNQDYVNDRINKYISFILKELNPSSPIFLSHEADRKLINMSKFAHYFTLILNGLLLSPFQKKVIELNIDFESFLSIIKNINKFTIISNEVMKLITILLIPNKKLRLNKFLDPEEAILLLHELYQNSFNFEYIDILSYLVSNNLIYEKICYKMGILSYYCNELLQHINEGIRGKNMLCLMNVLKNMSFAKSFVKVVRENDYDFKILDAVKNKDEKSDSILINNNVNFLSNLVTFIRNNVIAYPECQVRLAEMLINDLEICKKKIDKVYTNNVLMPLLRMEKVVNLCIQPIDTFLNNIYSMYCNLQQPTQVSQEKQELVINDPFLQSTALPQKTQDLLKMLFTKHEYSPKNKFNIDKFKMVFSSKNTEKNNFYSSVATAISNITSFMIILYPSKNNELYTIFYCNGTIPSLPTNLSVNDSNTLNIPYTYQNFLAQINGENYITTNIKPEMDDTTGKEYEIGYVYYDGYSANLNINGDIINMFLLDPGNSSVNPYPDGINVHKSKGITELTYVGVKDYEIFVAVNDKKSSEVNINHNKIISTKYIDETGNLDNERIKMMKYYKENHPMLVTRNNPVFEFPINISIKTLKDFLINENVDLRLLSNQDNIQSDISLIELYDKSNFEENNILDLSYDISSLRGILGNAEQPLTVIPNYEPKLPVFEAFEKLDGIRKIVFVLKNSIKMWKNKEAILFWIKWIDDVEKFSELPSFFATLIRHSKCFDIIFNLLCGLYDDTASHKEIGNEANRYIYEILNNTLIATESIELRNVAIEKGIFGNILQRLQLLTREKPRIYKPGDEVMEPIEIQDKKDTSSNKKNNKKGVGYGSDHTGDNKGWDVNEYLDGKKNNSEQTASIIKLLTNFFNTKELVLNQNLERLILESSIIPVLESAFRGGTLLELTKEENLYYAYLNMTLKLSENQNLIPFLLDINKDYKPVQTESVFTLLNQLNEGAKIFSSCLKTNSSNEEKTIEEKLALEITRVNEKVTENVQKYKKNLNMDKHYGELLKLPLEKSYPALMRELSFDYMNMKDSNGKIVHYYLSSMSGGVSSIKLIRLAQEYADLSRSLPCEHTNAIFVRVDKDNMDLMKVLIMGSAGTPYAHGAFEFDVYFDSQYPNVSPKVNLMTTGNGSVRFNPNLYANGKVCLSLLGTWRGQSTENWDPKISTLLQVLISIQSIIMSDLVYFNEPSCESEMGKPEGEAKNEAYSNIVRYCNIKFSMLEQIRKPSKGFEEVIKRHFYLKKDMIIEEAKQWIERSKTAEAKYSSFSYDHNPTWAQKFNSPKQYTKMLEEIFQELENELNELPIPSELVKKTEESEKLARDKAKKETQMEFVSLDNVDVTYDNELVTNKEINIDDEAVKDRWSRYIGAMGLDAVQRQANSSVFLSGASGLGIEIAKNIVLSGCKKFVLHDTKKTSHLDLSSQFFLSEDDIGLNRAQACIKKLQQLNLYVKIQASTAYLPKTEADLDKFGLKDFNIVILSQIDYETAISINKYCRNRGIHMIYTDIYGVFGRIINDFGEKFNVYDKDGEELRECMIKSINENKVTLIDNTRHEFSDGDEIVLNEIEGMNLKDNSNQIENMNKTINGNKYKITVIDPHNFKIEGLDMTLYTEYLRGGIAKQIKIVNEIKFKDLETVLNNPNESLDPNMQISDYTKMGNSIPLHIGFEAIDQFVKEKKSLPGIWSYDDAKEIINKAKELSNKYKHELSEPDIKILNMLSFTNQAQLSPLCAFFGGFVAQEAIKAMTGKFTPIYQTFYYDSLEVLPELDISNLEESVKKINIDMKKKRSDGLEMIIGNDLLTTISKMNILVVGSGAIGCELLKNFAMLEVGTFLGTQSEKSGSIIVTDPDIIEVSNLNRQFLFREKHLRKPKSVTAAAAVIQMNKNLKNHIYAKMDKVCEETENIFNDRFFSNLSLVANALDNIHARRYVDSRCVSNRVPLLESGTLGPKGHVQIVIPNNTESYSSQNDPEVTNDIPQCTLKMFPEEALHCMEWARDQFGKHFTQRPKNFNKILEEGDNQDIKIIKQVLKDLKNAPKDFDDCLRFARNRFQKYFFNNVKQLLYSYPLDKKNKDGTLFWSLPKRPPVEVIFDPEDNLHSSFIASYACLLANQFKIKIPYDHPRKESNKTDMAKKANNFTVKEFQPNVLKAKSIEKAVEKEKLKEEQKDEVEDEKELFNDDDLKTELKDILTKNNLIGLDEKQIKEMGLVVEEFEKDNDVNYHIDFIYSLTNLRCRNYKLEEMDWIKVKLKAGRIIPALATTTAAIAGLQSLELIKIAKNLKIDHIRNSFLNLAIPFLQASEPGSITKYEIKKDLFTTLWDRWEIKPNPCTLFKVYEHLRNQYGLFPRDCFKGKKAIYSYNAYIGDDKNSLRDEIMNKNLSLLLGLYEDEEYVDLMITFTLEENDDQYLKNIPVIRIILK